MSESRVKGRRIPKSELAEYRERALEMRAEKMSARAVARVLGCGRSTVMGWFKQAREGGLSEPRKPSGRPPLLSDEQVARLYGMLFKDPRQLEFDFGLWTRKMVASVIEQKFGVSMTVQAVGRLLRDRLGMSPQRPLYRATQRDEEAIQRWKDTEFPKIVARARAEKAQIWFQDESSVRSDYHSGTTWAPVGRTPVITATGTRGRVNVISSVNARGGLHFRLLNGNVDAEAFIDYLRDLLTDIDAHKIFLIVDGHPAHRAQKAQDFIATTNGRLELFYLPAYAPELNPDEWVNKNIKHDNAGKAAVLRADQLPIVITTALHKLQQLPGTIKAFFSDPALTYIQNAYKSINLSSH